MAWPSGPRRARPAQGPARLLGPARGHIAGSHTLAADNPERAPLAENPKPPSSRAPGSLGAVPAVAVDGADDISTASGIQRGTPPQESVQEFRVINTDYSAEFGRATAGIVNIITRSGTWSGSTAT